MNKEEALEKIFELTPHLFRTKEFVPGEDFVYTGWAIYDFKELNAILESVISGRLGWSKIGEEFERKFSTYLNRNKTLAVNSGSSASFLSVIAAKNFYDLKKGDEIITPACGFPTTVNPIIQAGLTPHFVDIDETMSISPRSLEKAINSKTKGIIFAHTLGNPAKMEEIMSLARANNLFVIEDCCDAYGALYQGKKVGTFGDVALASFYPAHGITLGGEGGSISLDNPEMHKILRSLRDWGRDCHCMAGQDNACGKRFNYTLKGIPWDHKYLFSNLGYNLKPTEMQAAFGLEQLKRLENLNEKRRENFKLYSDRLKGLQNFLKGPEIHPHAEPVFFGYPLEIINSSCNREDLVRYLNEKKIGTRFLFGGNLTYHPAYANVNFKVQKDLTRTNLVTENLFWMGIHPGMGEGEIDYIGSVLEDYFKLR